jgi:DNA-binding transcriptional ArsR family regulator
MARNRARSLILDVLRDKPRTLKQIREAVDLAPRTVSYTLRWLKEHGIIVVTPNLSDMRQPIYSFRSDANYSPEQTNNAHAPAPKDL